MKVQPGDLLLPRTGFIVYHRPPIRGVKRTIRHWYQRPGQFIMAISQRKMSGTEFTQLLTPGGICWTYSEVMAIMREEQ